MLNFSLAQIKSIFFKAKLYQISRSPKLVVYFHWYFIFLVWFFVVSTLFMPFKMLLRIPTKPGREVVAYWLLTIKSRLFVTYIFTKYSQKYLKIPWWESLRVTGNTELNKVKVSKDFYTECLKFHRICSATLANNIALLR